MWGVYNGNMKEEARFSFGDRQAAEEKLVQLREKSAKKLFFIQPIKVPLGDAVAAGLGGLGHSPHVQAAGGSTCHRSFSGRVGPAVRCPGGRSLPPPAASVRGPWALLRSLDRSGRSDRTSYSGCFWRAGRKVLTACRKAFGRLRGGKRV